eukprot:NODE_576_length_5827_cov_0.654853.p4 type:complete len:205 gc:universal NODE_576_length_5827_cov_0.654853:4363-4977(+)
MPQFESIPRFQNSHDITHLTNSMDQQVDNLIQILRENVNNDVGNRNPFEKFLNPIVEELPIKRKELSPLQTKNLLLPSDENLSPKSPKSYTTVHSSNGVHYSCLVCDVQFRHKPDVIRHSKNVHSNREACKFCGKLLKTTGRSDAKRKHLENCSGFLKKLPNDISKEKINKVVRAIVGDKRRKHQPLSPVDDDCHDLVASLLCQ